VEGYRPAAGGLELRDGFFKQFCSVARQNSENSYVLIIDEINRGNVSRIFGELLSLVEVDKRGPEYGVQLAYSGPGSHPFHVTPNVYILGLMNTADRSLAFVDYALRRRFAFRTVSPAFGRAQFSDYPSSGRTSGDGRKDCRPAHKVERDHRGRRAEPWTWVSDRAFVLLCAEDGRGARRILVPRRNRERGHPADRGVLGWRSRQGCRGQGSTALVSIPIRNIYYLLLYAWDRLDERDEASVDGLETTQLVELFGRLLHGATPRIFRRGIDRSYRPTTQVLTGARGRIELTPTLTQALLARGRTVCTYDELTADSPANQVLKAAAERVLVMSGLDVGIANLMRECVALLRPVTSLP